MTYQLEITEQAERTYREQLDYLLHHVGNTGNFQAAVKFYRDFKKATDLLSKFPQSGTVCEDIKIGAFELRRLHFAKLNYKLFYHIANSIIYIDLITHDLQDYTQFF